MTSIDADLQHGKVISEESFFNGEVVSRRRSFVKSIKPRDIIDAQEKILDYSNDLIKTGETDHLTFELYGDVETGSVKTLKISWRLKSDKTVVN